MSRVPGSGQEDQDGQDGQDVLPAVHESLHSLASLRHRHVDTVTRLERGQSLRNTDAEGLLMRINETKDSLQRLELGLEEGGLVIALTEYEQQLEQDQVQREVELLKIKDENDWLREELEETERRLEDVLSTIAALEITKQHHHFIQEVKRLISALILPQEKCAYQIILAMFFSMFFSYQMILIEWFTKN